MTPVSRFPETRDVSRETRERLEAFEVLLRKWTPSINLVARSTLDDLWRRHFQDSIQVFDLAPVQIRAWGDLGSGGGFPGLVVAIVAAEERPDLSVTLVESDQRKAAFLAEAARQLDLRTTQVMPERAEILTPLSADVISARALAPLDKLLSLAHRHLAPDGTALFPKGATYRSELSTALESWAFRHQKVPSKTDPEAVILSIGGIRRV